MCTRLKQTLMALISVILLSSVSSPVYSASHPSASYSDSEESTDLAFVGGAAALGARYVLIQALGTLVAVSGALLAASPLLEDSLLALWHDQWHGALQGSVLLTDLSALTGDLETSEEASQATVAQDRELLDSIMERSASWGKIKASIEELEEKRVEELEEKKATGELSEEEYLDEAAALQEEAEAAKEQLQEVEKSYFDLLSELAKVMKQLSKQKQVSHY